LRQQGEWPNLSLTPRGPIYTGIRTLCPACDLIFSTVAANNIHRLEDIKEVVVELVKDCCWKLNETNNKGKMVVPNPTIPPELVVLHVSLLPPEAPNQWVAATTIGNPGQLPSNPPTAHVPAGAQLGQRRTLYHSVAGVKLNDPPQLNSGSQK